MKKIFSLLLAVLMVVLVVAGCAPKQAEKTTMKIAAISGPTGMGMVSLMEETALGNAKHDYKFTVVTDPTQIVGKITSKEFDIAAVPTNMASAIYKKTSGGVSVLALNTGGNLFIIEKKNTVSKIADLKGKTIYATGQGANPEFILNYVLKSNGLTVGTDVEVEYVADAKALIGVAQQNDDAVLLAPQPAATSILGTIKGSKAVIDMTKEFETAAGKKMYMGCIIVRNEFLKENELAVKEFLKEYEASVNVILNDIEKGAALCEKYEIIPKAAVAKQAIPTSGVCFVAGEEMKTALADYLSICLAEMPKLVGGELPGDEFYFTGK
ncbi:MAG: ABC transporter substrate-binding protein [Ruminococcaceae bacterium]|nr:ABC transporter substrate-binding protein [Oscillospiraceae bacterium]